jgi:hypothetical protein
VKLYESITSSKLHKRFVADKVNPTKFCDCPGSEPRKIIANVNAHLPGCRYRKLSSRYTTNESVVPDKIVDGYSLGVVLREGCY